MSTSDVSPQVDFDRVSVTYDQDGVAVEACRSVTFTVERGRSVALIGPSGCGKSTTLLMAAGLLQPTSGMVRVAGEILDKPRHETAFIPQDLGLFPWKTVIQNAALGLILHGVSKAEAYEKAEQVLEAVGLGGFERVYPKDLSGGMRQRLALARALVIKADLLLMDEPLSAIDALLRESLQDMLLQFWQQGALTQMLVTHSIEEAVYLGQRILVFSARPGTIVAQIENDEVGEVGWRDSAGFAHKCKEVRAALDASVQASEGRPLFTNGICNSNSSALFSRAVTPDEKSCR